MLELQKKLLRLANIKLSKTQAYMVTNFVSNPYAYIETFIGVSRDFGSSRRTMRDELRRHAMAAGAASSTPEFGVLVKKLKNKAESHKPWSKKRFYGVEIEFCLPRGKWEDLNNLTTYGVTLKDDGSLRTKYELMSSDQRRNSGLSSDPDVSCEITICAPQGSYTQLKKVLAFLNDNGAYVNTSCGVHVHLDQRHNERKEALNVYTRLQNSLAPLLTKLVDQSRLRPRGTNYCQLNRDTDNKYQAVNFLPYENGRNTIEVRLHHGSLDFAEITNWIDTLLLVSEAYGLVRPKKQKTFSEMLELLELKEERKAILEEIARRKMEAVNLDAVMEA